MAINKNRLQNTQDWLMSVYNYIVEKRAEKQNEVANCSDVKSLKDLSYELIFLCEQERNLDVVFKFLDDLQEEIED